MSMVYVVWQPADDDWDHSPALLGVYLSEDAATARAVKYGGRFGSGYGEHGPKVQVLAVEDGADLDIKMHAIRR